MRRDQGSIRERTKGRWEIRIELGRGLDGKRKRKIVQFKGQVLDEAKCSGFGGQPLICWQKRSQ